METKQKFKSQPDFTEDEDSDLLRENHRRHNISANDLLDRDRPGQWLPSVHKQQQSCQIIRNDEFQQTFGAPKGFAKRKFPKEVFLGNVSKAKRQFQNYYIN